MSSNNGGVLGFLGNLNPLASAPTSPEVERLRKERTELETKHAKEKAELETKHKQELDALDAQIKQAETDTQQLSESQSSTTPNPDGVGGKRKRKHTKRNHKKKSKKGRTGRKSSRL